MKSPLLWLSCVAVCSIAFYVPGMAPRSFKRDEIVEIKAVKLTSIIAQLPYDYYSLAFCQPKDMIYKSENLGEVLRGDRIVNTPYKVNMLKSISCLDVCDKVTLDKEASALMAKRIQQQYSVHLLTDNLPIATKIQDSKQNEVIYRRGYWLGFMEKGVAYINNHLKFTILYHTSKDENNLVYEIVGFQVVAISIKHSDGQCNIKDNHWQPISEKDSTDVRFTYEVEWVPKDIEWSSRWNNYLDMRDTQIHWFSIVNSLVVVCFLASILALIIVRTLKRDITRYNTLDDEEDTFEETGWKLVHGDVFRPPRYPRALAVLIGSGVQLFSSSFFVIIFAVLGMLSPANRGSLMTVALFTFVFVGMLAGFHSGRIYKTILGKHWKRSALTMAMFYPSVIFGVCFILNFFIWGKHSSGAVPFKTMVALVCMWMGISVPLILIGFYYGYRKKPYTHPNRTNRIPRQVPEQSWYYNPFIGMLLAGILPFGAMFIELFFIFTAIWENQFYYLFGFLFLVFLILVVSCSQISIVMVYFQLCSEDYHWWWRSFIVSGGSSLYVFAYSIFYFIAKLDITEFTPTLLYFGYTLLMVFTFWIVTGTIGFFAAYFFIRKIYGAIKIE